MGFLDTLKDIGFGNTGPYGRMDSGATNYSQYFQQRNAFESERGVSQAIAEAAKGGKPISLNALVEMSDMWNIPLNELIQRTKPLNEELDRTMRKKRITAAVQSYYDDKAKEPNLEIDENYIMKKAQQFELDGIDMGMIKDMIVKMRPEKKVVALGTGDQLQEITTSLGGKNTAQLLAENKKSEKPELDKTKIDIEKDGRKLSVPNYQLDKYLAAGWQLGQTSEGAGLDDRYKMEQQILSIAKQITGLEAGENLVDEALKSETRTATITDAKARLELMVKEYENTYGKGSARKIGFGGGSQSSGGGKTLTKEIATKYLEKANNDIEKARKMARDDGYVF